MKRIVLALSLLLILVQNGFAETDAEWDNLIANASNETIRELNRCSKATLNHKFNSNVNICIKSLKLLKKNYPSEKNFIKAYKYYMKAAKLGNTTAQSNLDVLCRKHSWVCKQ